jgi:hypothetical protein
MELIPQQVKVIRIAAHATQDIKENEITRLQAVPRANQVVYDKPYKLCLKRVSPNLRPQPTIKVPDHVPSAVTGPSFSRLPVNTMVLRQSARCLEHHWPILDVYLTGRTCEGYWKSSTKMVSLIRFCVKQLVRS